MEQTDESLTNDTPEEKSRAERGRASSKEPKYKQLMSIQDFVKQKEDLNTMVFNIQAAAEAREVQWRMEIDKARKARLELLEDHSLSCKEKIEEISKGWFTAKEKMIPQEVQALLIHQQQLCSEVIADKKKIIDAIQQDLKARDDSFVTDLKKQTEELQLMLERMMEQDNTLTKAYRDELERWKDTVEKEEETKRTEEKTAWEQCMKKLLDTEVKKLQKRQEAVEKYDTEIYHMIFELSDKFDVYKKREVSQFQSMELEMQQAKSENIFLERKIKKQVAEVAKLKAEDTQLKKELISVKSELKKLWMNEQTGKRRRQKQYMEKHIKELNRKAEDNKRIQKKILHYALADTITFENMWLTLDAEVKELVERALYIDSMIYKQVLHLPWNPPNLSFVEPGRRWEEGCVFSQTSQCTQDQGFSTQSDAGNRNVAMEGFFNENGSEPEARGTAKDSNTLTPRTLKTLMELLCDETGFLFEVKLVKLLDSLDEKEHTVVKMGFLFNALGIEEKDVSKLVNFLYKYLAQQSPNESKDIEKCEPDLSTESSFVVSETSEIIDRNYLLHALRCFLERHKQERLVKFNV